MEENLKPQKNFRFSSDMLENLKTITNQLHCNETQALAYALQQTAGQIQQDAQASQRELKLHRKYLNELRRNEFLILDLLNAICMNLNVETVLDHSQKDFVGPALADAKSNLSSYLHNILTRQKSGDQVSEEEQLARLMEGEADEKAKL